MYRYTWLQSKSTETHFRLLWMTLMNVAVSFVTFFIDTLIKYLIAAQVSN